MFSLFREGPIRPPACVAVELFLDSSGRESVAERLATEGSCVARLSDGEPPLATLEGDYPVAISQEEGEYPLGTGKGEWEGNYPLMTLEEGADGFNTSLPTSEGISEYFGRGTDLNPVYARVLSEEPLPPSNVGQGSSAERKAKRGAFGRFVSALETTQQSALDPPTLLT